MSNEIGPRTRVNAATLPKLNGRPVILLGAVQQKDSTGENIQVKTTDGQLIVVKLKEPLQDDLHGVAEFHGVSCGRQMIADFFIAFPNDYTDNFDAETYDQAIKMIHSVSNNAWYFE